MIPANITTRQTSGTGASNKGSPLTNSELDNNFININDSLVELQGLIGGSGLELGNMQYSQIYGNTAYINDGQLTTNGKNVLMYKSNTSAMQIMLDESSGSGTSLFNYMSSANSSTTYTVLVYFMNEGSSQMTLSWLNNSSSWTKVFPAGTPPAGPAAGQVNAYLLNYVYSSSSLMPPSGSNLSSNANVFIYPVATNLQGVN